MSSLGKAEEEEDNPRQLLCTQSCPNGGGEARGRRRSTDNASARSSPVPAPGVPRTAPGEGGIHHTAVRGRGRVGAGGSASGQITEGELVSGGPFCNAMGSL